MIDWSVCPYCCKPLSCETGDARARESEHVIPSAVGGNLEVLACATCNRRVGRIFDRRVLDDPRVKIRRAVYGIKPIRGSYDVRRLAVTGRLSAGGAKARWSPGDPENEIVMLTASKIEYQGDGTFSFTCPTDNREAWLRRVVEQARTDHPGRTVTLGELEQRVDDKAGFEFSYDLDPTLWPRFAAKVGLCLGGITFGESWLATDEAWKLRGLLRQGGTYRGQFPEGYGVPAMPTEVGFDEGELQRELHRLLAPREHYLGIDAVGRGALAFTIGLFGAELLYRLVVNTEHSVPSGGRGWLLDGSGGALRMRRDTLVGWLALREDEFGSPLRLRRHVPLPSSVNRVVRGAGTVSGTIA